MLCYAEPVKQVVVGVVGPVHFLGDNEHLFNNYVTLFSVIFDPAL